MFFFSRFRLFRLSGVDKVLPVVSDCMKLVFLFLVVFCSFGSLLVDEVSGCLRHCQDVVLCASVVSVRSLKCLCCFWYC